MNNSLARRGSGSGKCWGIGGKVYHEPGARQVQPGAHCVECNGHCNLDCMKTAGHTRDLEEAAIERSRTTKRKGSGATAMADAAASSESEREGSTPESIAQAMNDAAPQLARKKAYRLDRVGSGAALRAQEAEEHAADQPGATEDSIRSAGRDAAPHRAHQLNYDRDSRGSGAALRAQEAVELAAAQPGATQQSIRDAERAAAPQMVAHSDYRRQYKRQKRAQRNLLIDEALAFLGHVIPPNDDMLHLTQTALLRTGGSLLPVANGNSLTLPSDARVIVNVAVVPANLGQTNDHFNQVYEALAGIFFRPYRYHQIRINPRTGAPIMGHFDFTRVLINRGAVVFEVTPNRPSHHAFAAEARGQEIVLPLLSRDRRGFSNIGTGGGGPSVRAAAIVIVDLNKINDLVEPVADVIRITRVKALSARTRERSLIRSASRSASPRAAMTPEEEEAEVVANVDAEAEQEADEDEDDLEAYAFASNEPDLRYGSADVIDDRSGGAGNADDNNMQEDGVVYEEGVDDYFQGLMQAAAGGGGGGGGVPSAPIRPEPVRARPLPPHRRYEILPPPSSSSSRNSSALPSRSQSPALLSGSTSPSMLMSSTTPSRSQSPLATPFQGGVPSSSKSAMQRAVGSSSSSSSSESVGRGIQLLPKNLFLSTASPGVEMRLPSSMSGHTVPPSHWSSLIMTDSDSDSGSRSGSGAVRGSMQPPPNKAHKRPGAQSALEAFGFGANRGAIGSPRLLPPQQPHPALAVNAPDVGAGQRQVATEAATRKVSLLGKEIGRAVQSTAPVLPVVTTQPRKRGHLVITDEDDDVFSSSSSSLLPPPPPLLPPPLLPPAAAPVRGTKRKRDELDPGDSADDVPDEQPSRGQPKDPTDPSSS